MNLLGPGGRRERIQERERGRGRERERERERERDDRGRWNEVEGVLISQAVNEESMLVLAHDRDKLVHDAAGHAGIAVLGLLAQQGLVCRGAQMHSRTQLLNELAGGHLQSGRAGETPAQRH